MDNGPVVLESDDDAKTSARRPMGIKRMKREERLQKKEEWFTSYINDIKEEMVRTNDVIEKLQERK